MKEQIKLPILQQIEDLFGKNFQLHLPKNTRAPLRGVMGAQKDYPKYALDESGNLIGLNLAMTGLDDAKWEAITDLMDQAKVRLQALDLNENELTHFALKPCLSELQLLDIDDNPLESPPEEIRKQGKDAVLRFLRELEEQGARELFEVKMLIVGEGETGKTTLWNLLQNPDHPVPDTSQKSTIGIQIEEGWSFNHLDRLEEPFLVNLWDFGGQDIQYMTHQFFLTRRSFYVLLADGRREVANFSYWLQIIELLGCDQDGEDRLPVLVVLNEKGNPIARMPYDPVKVKEDYKKLEVIKREVDFAKKEDGRLDALIQTIKELLCRRIDHLPLTIPAFWDNVRRALQILRKTKNHIDSDTFSQICKDNGIEDQQQQEDLSQLLHDLGIILHFREDINLADFIVLNPQWAVNAVYEIMKHEEVKKENQGRFDQQLLRRIWTEKGYTTKEQQKLLNLMLKNNLEVCFRARENGREIYIAPQLLPESLPEGLSWKETPETLRYIFHYPFMPKGLIGRLIVRLNEDIESKGRRQVVWERGMVLQKDGCRAQVQFLDDKDQGRQIIKMEVQGLSSEDRKNVLRDIRLELERIHRRSFPSLAVNELVPCNCSECAQSIDPYEHKYEELKKARDKNGPTAPIQCKSSFEMVPVQQLLDSVFIAQEIERGGKDTHIHINVDAGAKEGIDRLRQDMKGIKEDTSAIRFTTEMLEINLDTLLVYAEGHQEEIEALFRRVDAIPSSNQDFQRINTLLEEQLDKYFTQLPSNSPIVQEWKSTKEKLPHIPDAKWKFKLKIPLVFGEFEKELSWDMKAALKMIRSEINAVRKGEKTIGELFVEED